MNTIQLASDESESPVNLQASYIPLILLKQYKTLNRCWWVSPVGVTSWNKPICVLKYLATYQTQTPRNELVQQRAFSDQLRVVGALHDP